MDMSEDNKYIYYCHNLHTINMLSCSNNMIVSSISTPVDQFNSIQCKHMMIYSMYQTIIGEQNIALYDNKLSATLASLSINNGIQIFDACNDNLNLIVAVGFKSLKKISFISTIDLNNRSVNSENLNISLVSVKKLQYLRCEDNLYTYLIASGSLIHIAKVLLQQTTSNVIISGSLSIQTNSNIYDMVYRFDDEEEGEEDDELIVITNDGTIRVLYNVDSMV